MSALDNLKELLNTPVRVVLSDGRVIEGNLHCMDKDLNFIISDAQEFHGVSEGKTVMTLVSQSCMLIRPPRICLYFDVAAAESLDKKDAVVRYLGNAMVPGIHVVKVLALSQ